MVRNCLTALSFSTCIVFQSAEAEINPMDGGRYVLNDETAAFSLSMARFERVYIGQFNFKHISPSDYKPGSGYFFIESNFKVSAVLKGSLPSGSVEIDFINSQGRNLSPVNSQIDFAGFHAGSLPSRNLEIDLISFHACIDHKEHDSLLAKIDLLSNQGVTGVRNAEKMLAELSKRQSGEECFVAEYILQGDLEEAYKAKYEIIFENQKYALFTNDLSTKITSIKDEAVKVSV